MFKRDAIGVDFDKLSQLLCRTKTTLLSKSQIEELVQIRENLFHEDSKGPSFKPDLHNVDHWFPIGNIRDLSYLKERIEAIHKETEDEQIYDFLRVCFASIIKKCSFADKMSPKPYISKKIKKEPIMVKDAFIKTLSLNLKRMDEYSGTRLGNAHVVSEDARNFNRPEYQQTVSVAVTSPPYINAFDYVRSLRLENAWLGFYGDSNIIDIKRRQVGTEYIPAKLYSSEFKEFGLSKLDSINRSIYAKDKKRAFVVFKFFEDMEKNFCEVRKLLERNAHYVVVIGDSTIRGIDVPTHEILVDIAKQRGFRLENQFAYVIKNRYLRIPRSGRGGLIKKDWVIDLVKTNE